MNPWLGEILLLKKSSSTYSGGGKIPIHWQVISELLSSFFARGTVKTKCMPVPRHCLAFVGETAKRPKSIDDQ